MDTEHEPLLVVTESKRPDGVQTVEVAGELDMVTAPELLAALVRCAEGEVHLDLSSVTFIDSSGLHALVQAHHTMEDRGARLLVYGATPATLRVIDVTGLDRVLNLDGQAPPAAG